MSNDWLAHWGNWIRTRAKFVGIDLKDVAVACKTSPQNLSRWLRHDRMPSIREKYRAPLAEALKIEKNALPFVEVLWHPEDDEVRIDPRLVPALTSSPRKQVMESDSRKRLLALVHETIDQLDDDGVLDLTEYVTNLYRASTARNHLDQIQVAMRRAKEKMKQALDKGHGPT